MASFTYPGVYIEELSSGQHTITGVATSIGAFIGWAPQGPVTAATLVQSWSDYQTLFGGLDSRSWLGYAVNQFFANGGDQCYIIRLVWDGSITTGANSPVACETALAAGVGYGTATISAAYGGFSGAITLGVGTPVLQSVTVLPQGMAAPASGPPPPLPPLPFGASLTLSATGNFSDGSTPALTTATWVSSDTSILTVSPSGVVTGGSKAGTATVTAVSGIITGSLAITVTAASISSIIVTPAMIAAVVGQTVQLAATAKYSDGSSPDITSLAVFSCHDAGKVTFVSTPKVPLAPGQFLAQVADAGTTLSAAMPSTWSIPAPTAVTAALVISAAVVTAMAISPANATVVLPADLELGETEPTAFTVATTLSDGTPGPVPTVTWVSSNTAVATVDSSGNVTILSTGTTTISASYIPTGSSVPISASTPFTVSAGHLTGLNVSPNTLTLAGGMSQQLTVTGTFDDGSFVDMSGYARWTSSSAGATVSSTGLVTAATGITSNESVTITAEWMNISATAALTVTPPIPTSIAITTTPLGTTSVASGTNLSLVATATLSDGTTSVVTGIAAWSSSAPTLISIAGPGVVAAAAAAGGSLTLFATNPGIWGNSLRVSISVLPPPNSTRFSLLVQQLGSNGQLKTLESYVNLSVLPSDPNYVVTVINNDSNYITFTDPATLANVIPTAAPAATTTPIAFTGGADGTVLAPATDGNFEIAMTSNSNAGFNLLDRVDIFNLLCVPGETDAPTISTLQAYCALKRAFMIVDSPQLATISNLIQSGPVGSTAGSITGEHSSNSAFYFPWILAPDPLVGNRPALFPPCGFVAGIYAATDSARGVWKAPAGINASLTGNSGLQYVLTDIENGSLNTQAINCLRQFKVYGDIVWGARTLAGNDQAGSQWKYVPIRRLALFLESSLFDGTQWVVFEPNDETLWGQVRLNVGTFMQGLFLQGAFAGTTPAQAYFVKCDAENNPPASVALGVVNILVGFAPLYPAEFVVIQIQQIVAQAS